jgi:acyl-coenzyme A synthetase/AMP-(fatty) acid ligase
MTLSQGGTVVLVENALGLANAEARRSVTLIHTVPSAMTELLRQEAVPPSVCTVNLAGEVLSPKLIKNAYRQAPDIERVLNLFGPTENAQYTTLEKISRTAEDVYIGKPLENTRLYILDHALEPVGRGVIGELCIASTGLARGYHKRPELTAERFIPGEFGNESGSRIYRTGDLCRYLPDGRLEYRGRADRQIKLRGFRIELGEVEEAIRALPGVGAAAVVVAEGPAGEKHLVAYVEQAANLPADGQVIKSSLREKLPGYMVPSQITLMDALPLTPNGKIDRAALPTTFSGSGGSDYVAPSTAAESKLYEIWREVLGIEKIGVDDNFFDLGGHSLLATQVVSRIQRSFNQQMPLQTFFQRPTIRSIAEIIADGADERKAPSAIVALPRGKRSLEELLAEVNQIPDPEIRDAEPVAEKAEGGIAS